MGRETRLPKKTPQKSPQIFLQKIPSDNHLQNTLMHGLWQQNKENRNANRVTAELGSHCPLGESQLLWTINIYITVVSWGNRWTEKAILQRLVHVFRCRQYLYSEISLYTAWLALSAMKPPSQMSSPQIYREWEKEDKCVWMWMHPAPL